MIFAVDSWWEPTPAQIATAKAAGVQAWMGYFSNGSDRIYHGWQDSTFQSILAAGLKTGAYCSQYADPGWVKSRAAALGIPAILDDESSIHADDANTDPWLATSGAGLYGGSGVQAAHRSHGHPFYVAAYYPAPAVVQTSLWPSAIALPSPARPTGWQYGGSWTEPYGTVDVSNFDPAILSVIPPVIPPPTPVPPKEDPMYLVVFAGGGFVLFCPASKLCVPVPDGPSIDAWKAAGVPEVIVSQAEFEAIVAACA
jgi:hypothetical protein